MCRVTENWLSGRRDDLLPPVDGDLAVVGCAKELIGHDPYEGHTGGRDDAPAVLHVAAWAARNPNAIVFAKNGCNQKSGEEWKAELAALLTLDDFESAFNAAMVQLDRLGYEIPVGNRPFMEDVLARMPSYEVMF
jgi:predicted secreted protein